MNAIALNPKSTAALIRQVLKKAFPATTFSVRTARGSMVSSVDISWTDGPTVKLVDSFVECFEDGHFDGMQDMHVSATGADRFLVVDGQTYERGVRYVQTSRTISPRLANRCIAQIAAYWAGVENVPTAVESTYASGAFTFADPSDFRRAIGPSFSPCTHDWSTMIHQAAGDASRFAREVSV